MSESPFYGRQEELDRLNALLKKSTSSLVAIKGRRRIGKSRLIQEFSKELPTHIFIGLPPDKNTTGQTQREYFVQQMERELNLKGLKADDWGDIFWHLGKQVRRGRKILVLDEINWIGSLDPTFLGKLKTAWDLYFKINPKLVMILSGSMSSWIDQNILSSTGFMGRVSLELALEELPLSVCHLFWREKAKWVSPYEKFKILSVTGGVPRYLEEIDPSLSAESNIYQLAFRKGGLLVEEFDRIFSDLFSRRSVTYKAMVAQLAGGSATLDEVCKSLNLEKGGAVSGYLEDLVETGYVAKDRTWNIRNAKESNLFKFRLKDNYLRFYLKYIEPNLTRIEKNLIKLPPAWDSIMGYQFENIVLNNSKKIYELLNLDPGEVVYDNPYFQRASREHLGCQLDYLIQSKFSTLYVCEIKFLKDSIGPWIVKEVEEKIKRLAKPRNFSVRPVLIHVNGVSSSVVESDFFAKILDFGELLKI